MKKMKFLCIVLMFSCVFTTAYASEMKMYLNGSEIIPLAEKHQPATVVDGELYLPLRNVYEAIGAVVNWDRGYEIASGGMGGMNYEAYANSQKLIVNGKEYEVKKILILNDRTMIGSDVIANCFGASVNWDGASKDVFITYQPDESTIMVVDFSDVEVE